MIIISIGRNPSNKIVIHDPTNTVSRTHGEIRITDNVNIYYRDYSRNGTIVNDKVIRNSEQLVQRDTPIVFPNNSLLDWNRVPRPSHLPNVKTEITIGRNPDNRIQLCGDNISRYHAVLKITNDGKYYIYDQSMNGTSVNGIKIPSFTDYQVNRRDAIVFASSQQLDWNEVSESEFIKPIKPIKPVKSSKPSKPVRPITYILPIAVIVVGLIVWSILVNRKKPIPEPVPVPVKVIPTPSEVEEKPMFDALKEKIKECDNRKFDNYDEAISTFSQLKNDLNDFVQSAKNNENISHAKKYIEKIDNKLQNISQERTDFESTTYSNDVSDIETFLIKYPNSIMRATLSNKIDQIYFSNFRNSINFSPKSIMELNSSVSKAKSYLEEIQSTELKEKIKKSIDELESKRRQVLKTEKDDKLQDLIKRMEGKAKEEASNRHRGCNVETCVARSSYPEIVGNSGDIEQVYQVNMKGKFWRLDGVIRDSDRYEMEIMVTGRIKGDINSGVTVSVTGARILSDKPYKLAK